MRWAAFVVALSAFAALVVAHGPRVADVSRFWTHGDLAPDSSPLSPIHVYLQLRDPKDRCDSPSLSLRERGQCMHTNAKISDIAILEQWFRPVGFRVAGESEVARRSNASGCALHWNAVHCHGLTVGHAKRLFGGHLQFYSYHSSVKAGHASTWTEGVLDIPAGAQVIVVSGLHPYDAGRMHGRHFGRSPRREQRRRRSTAANQKKARTMRGQSVGWPDFDPVEWNNWKYAGSPPDGAKATVVNFDQQFVYMLLKCGDGSFAQYSSPQTFANMCLSASPPAAVTAVVSQRDALSTVVLRAPLHDLGNNCNNADLFIVPVTSNVICRIDVSAAFANVPENQGNWTQYAVSVDVTYADGTTATSTPSAFFAGTTYVSGTLDINSLVLDGTPTTFTTLNNIVKVRTLWDRYQVASPNFPPNADGLAQGVVEFTDVDEPEEGFSVSDLQAFLANSPGQPTNAASQLMEVIGDSTIVSSGETTLDIELIMGVAPGAKSYIYCISYGLGGDFATYADALAGFASNAMHVGSGLAASAWSISYGGPEWTGDPLMTHINILFAILSNSGVTVTASSGDSGAYFYNGERNAAPDEVYPGPNWPASSPHVVAVGATALRLMQNATGAFLAEVTSMVSEGNVITSGGGISTEFSLPSYQASAVRASAIAGTQYRAIPDVSALGAWIYTILDGEMEPLFGTSASSPIIAALITLINAFLNSIGQHTLKQAPALFYNTSATSASPAFTDVTLGSNCFGEPVNPGFSGNFPAYAYTGDGASCRMTTNGYDPVTGLGTPIYPVLKLAAANWNPPAIPVPPQTPVVHTASSGILGGHTTYVVIGAVAAVGLSIGLFFLRRVLCRAAFRGGMRGNNNSRYNTNNNVTYGVPVNSADAQYRAMPVNNTNAGSIYYDNNGV